MILKAARDIGVVGAAVLFTAAVHGSEIELPSGAILLADDVFVEPLRPDVWRHVSFHRFPTIGPFPSNGLIVGTTHGTVLIDTAWNSRQTADVLDWAHKNVGPVDVVIITHAHVDRMGGLDEVHRRNIESVALKATVDLASAADDALIERSVSSGFRLERHGIQGEIFYPGAGHTTDNAVVFLEDARVLAGTCMVRAADTRSLGNVKDADLASWPTAIRALQQRYPTVELVVPGHGSPGGQDLLDHTLRLLESRGE